jgi:branched-chain amino acid transport system permease protein
MSRASSPPTGQTDRIEGPDPADAGVASAAGSTSPSALGRIRRLPLRPLLFAVIILLGLLYAYNEGSYTLFLADTVLVYAIAAMGQEWLIGRAGQVSVGGGALIWIGAFTVAKTRNTLWSNFPIPLILCAVVGALVGLVIGLPALRLRGVYLLLITLALNFLAQFAGYESQKNSASGFTAPAIRFGSFTISDPARTFLIVLAVALIVAAVLGNAYRGAPGQVWTAIRENETGAATMGIPTVRWKLIAFVGSSAITAVAGGLLTYVVGSESYESFSIGLALNLLVMVYLGGVGSIVGAVIGAAFVTLIPTWLNDLTSSLPQGGGFASWFLSNSAFVDNAVFGLALLVVLLYSPTGLVGIPGTVLKAVRRRRARRASATTPDRASSPVAAPHAPGSASARVAERVEAVRERGATGAVAGELRVSGLSVRYANGARAVAGVDLVLPAGEIGALVGRNGAGKTSLLRAIAGFMKVEGVSVDGSIQLGDTVLDRMRPERRGSHGVVLVSERDKVFPSVNVIDHLRILGLSRANARAALDRFAPLHGRYDSPAGLLSGGQRQLLALAVAMARKPKLLLVDEASQGLAPIAIQGFMQEISAIRQETGITILLTDQSAAAVTDAVTVVYLLEHGELIDIGDAAEFIARERESLVLRRQP